MKYALIGCGMICANHIRAALETGLEIVALCDLVEENREKALALIPEEKRSGVKLYAEYIFGPTHIKHPLSWRYVDGI